MKRTKWSAGLIPALVVAVGTACAGGDDAPNAGPADEPTFQVGGGQVPLFEPDPLHFSLLPNQWVNGQVGGLTVDSHDNVWILQRPLTIPAGEKAASLDPPKPTVAFPAPSVLQYDAGGQFVQAWGGPGEGYEWFSNEHGIWVDGQDKSG